MRFGIAEDAYRHVFFLDGDWNPGPRTGLSPTCVMKRNGDGRFWTGAIWQDSPVDLAMAEWDPSNFPGWYRVQKPTVSEWTQVTVTANAGTEEDVAYLWAQDTFEVDPKVDNLDAAITSRAPSSTALDKTTWTDGKAAYLDASVNARALEAGGNLAAVKAKTDNLPAAPANEATLLRALGLALENFVEDGIVRDGNGNKMGSAVYLYDSATHAGVHDKTTGLVAKYTLAAEYEDGLVKLLKMLRVA